MIQVFTHSLEQEICEIKQKGLSDEPMKDLSTLKKCDCCLIEDVAKAFMKTYDLSTLKNCDCCLIEDVAKAFMKNYDNLNKQYSLLSGTIFQ